MDSTLEKLAVRAVRADRQPARTLIEAMSAELSAAYGSLDDPRFPSATPAEMWAPNGTFLVLEAAPLVVAGGGLKRLEEEVAELKRMFVVPSMRGRGVARRLLGELERAATSLGYARLRLDTGPKQPDAEALYRSAGYEEIADYNANPWACFWAEKTL